MLLRSETPHAKTFIRAIVETLGEQLEVQGEDWEKGLKHFEAKIKDERIKKAFTLILDKGDMSLTELAKASGLSSRNLNRLFVAEVGQTPRQMMINLKIEKSKQLLTTTQLTVTDIAFEVGYNSLSKFISAFQKYTGKIPSEYRSLNQG